MKRILIKWIFLCMVGNVWADPTTPPLRVVASFSILADLAREVGGDKVEVVSLVPINADPHVYEPLPSDIKKLNMADVVFVNGLGFEGWLQRLIKAAGFKGDVTVVSDHIHPRLVFERTLIRDPHAWHSVPNAKIYVTNIRDAFIQKAPQWRDYFTQRAAVYLERLSALDGRIRRQIDEVPPPRRKIITAHDAFGYFGNTYGVQFLAPKGISTDAEAKVKNIVTLIEQIKKHNIKILFIENIADPKIIQQLSRETGATIGGTLYSDALSTPDGPASTYIRMIEYNIDLLIKGMKNK